jgi:hypothetical protein
MRRILFAAALLIAAAGCESDEPAAQQVHIVGLEEGAYLGGPQVTELETDPAIEVLRTELFLDGQLIAADELGPYRFEWDSRAFAEGEHQLLAKAHLVDGDIAEAALSVTIDNTAPTLGELSTSGIAGETYAIPVADNFHVARVEVERASQPLLVLDKAPFRFAWAGSCNESSSITVKAFDGTGATVSGQALVFTTDPSDSDCDGFISTQVGGDDCDDFDPEVHPGAPEVPEGFDSNCDGVLTPLPGLDNDGDGVLSIGDGGDDCNDTDAAIHGAFFAFRQEDVGVTWQPGEAVVVPAEEWKLFVNRGGTLQRFSAGSPGEVATSTVTTTANPDSVGSRASDSVAFGRGHDVVIAELQGQDWVERIAIHADATIGRLAFSPLYEGAEHLVYQAGTKVYFAQGVEGRWTSQLLVDTGVPLATPPRMNVAPYGANLIFHTATRAWSASRWGTDDALVVDDLGPQPSTILAVAVYTSIANYVAILAGAGTNLYSPVSSEPIQHFDKRVTGLSADYPYLFVRFADGSTEVRRLDEGFRVIQTITDLPAFDTSTYSRFFAGGGVVSVHSDAAVAPAADIDGDGIDQNCNHEDY